MATLVDRGTYWQLKWKYRPGPRRAKDAAKPLPQQLKFPVRDHGQAALAFVNSLNNQILDTDPRLTYEAYRVGPAVAAQREAAEKTWAWAVQRWLSVKVAQPSTIAGIRSRFNAHFTDWDHRPISTIDDDALNAKYVDMLAVGLARSTAEGYLATACELLNYAKTKGWTSFSAREARIGRLFNFKAPSQRQSAIRNSLTRPQLAALLAAMPTQRDRLVVWFMAATGARIGEVFALAVGDIDWTRGEVCIGHRMLGVNRAVGTKGSRGNEVGPAFNVVVEPNLLAALRSFCQGRHPDEPLFPRGASRGVRPNTSPFMPADLWRRLVFTPAVTTLAAAGVVPGHMTPHWLRHTTGTLSRQTMTSALLQEHMRHKDGRTTALYTHRDDHVVEATRQAIAEAFGFLDGGDAVAA